LPNAIIAKLKTLCLAKRQKKQPRNVVGCQRILNSTVVIENCTFAPTLTHMQKQRERERGIYRGQKERATHHTSTKSIDF